MNKKNFKLFRFLTVLMSLAMLLNSTSMTVLATGTGDFFDDSEVLVISPLSYSYGYLVYDLDENGNAIITDNTITEDTDLIIPSDIDGHKVISIGDYAFRSCYCLTGITIPKGVTSIGDHAFEDCESLTSINLSEGVTRIEGYTFAYCESLTSISMPDSVESIGEGAFYGCESLTSINLPEGVTSIGDYAFYSCESLTSINLPEGVTSIGEGAFYSCDSLTSINLPEGVTRIEGFTFAYCESLTSISMPDSVESIGEWAFYGCRSLTSISIPNGVTSIETCTFCCCYNLTSITIPESVNRIEDDAFDGADKIAIHGTKGSYAEEWANNHGIKFWPLGAVTEITLNKTRLDLSVNDSEKLTATIKPDDATNKAVNWTSTNTKVATVDENGLVKAVGAGSATITATAADGSGVKATCKVTVVKLVSEITLDKTDLLLHVGESDSINAKVTPADASNKEITWTSTNADVATVDSTGKVTAVGVGTATITATAADESGISASATVKVTKLVTDVFDDVKSTDWFVKSVQYVYDHGIMAGTNGGKSFSPNGKLTREQFTQVLYAYEGKPEVTNMSGFSDVDPKAWYAKSVYWAKEKGITGGKPNGTFGVNENISRQDLAVMLYTYAKIKNYDLTKNDTALDNFDDKGKVSNYAKDAMKWAVTQGVISGKGNGKVDPIGTATRAECATMIMKLIEKNK